MMTRLKLTSYTWFICLVGLLGGVTYGLVASSIYRIGRLQGNVTETVVASFGLATCAFHCEGSPTCQAFNYQESTETCEILASSLCDANETYQLQRNDPSWRYFDLMDYDTQESEHYFSNKALCTQDGLCSPKCERAMNLSCKYDEQCQVTTMNSICSKTAISTNSKGICECAPEYWHYNSTNTSLCIHFISYSSSFTWSFVYKKIVNNMCSMNFTVKVIPMLQLVLATSEDNVPNTPHYLLQIDQNGVLKKSGTEVVAINATILDNTFKNLSLSWCNGMIEFGLQGAPPLITYVDSAPLEINSIGFNAPNSSDGHIFIPQNLVDPYFPNTVQNKTIRTNGYDWYQVKLLPNASAVSAVNLLFDCMVPRSVILRLSGRQLNSSSLTIEIGALNNKYIIVTDPAGRNYQQPSLDVLSPTEFVSFGISLKGTNVQVWRRGVLLQSVNLDAKAFYSHLSVRTTQGDIGYFQFIEQATFWIYPNGGYVV